VTCSAVPVALLSSSEPGGSGFVRLIQMLWVFVMATELEDEWPVVRVDFLLYIQSMRRFMAGLQSKNTYQDCKQLRPIPLGNLLLWLKIQGGLVRGMGSSAFGGSDELAHFCSSPALPCDKFRR
jgi:hypothetical protein